eukprot:2398397-Pleurochrysis_carterae.AAC.2
MCVFQTTFGASREGSISIAMLFCYSALYAALLFVGKCTLSLIAIPRTFCGVRARRRAHAHELRIRLCSFLLSSSSAPFFSAP